MPHMSDPRFVDPRPPTSPTHGGPLGEPLPDDLAIEAARRLRVACLALATLWLIVPLMNHLVTPHLKLGADQVVPWSPMADALAIGCLLLSLVVYWIAPRAASIPGRLFNVAIVYQVAVGFAAGIINQWQPLALAGRLSWLCVLILIFPMLVPGPPRKVLLASLLTASMDPVGLLIAQARGLELPPLGLLVWTYLPNYICAGLAVLPSKIITQLGRKVSRARQLGSYRLTERIGRGGMGEVWKAEHQLFARPAAIKLIAGHAMVDASGQIAEERFRREAEAAAGLRSPHTIQLYDFGITRDRRLYYVMELLEGCDLESLVARYGPQPAARVAHILRQACLSLAEAHACGLVHRDIKPANVHIGRVGLEYDFVKVLDFGLVKRDGRTLRDDVRLTAPEAMSGTPTYMAPEVAAGEAVDARADLYALGCVGYFLVTGSLVFEGENAVQLVLKHIQTAPIAPSVRLGRPVPAELEDLILGCLAKAPADRPPDAASLGEALSQCGALEWTQKDARLWWENTYTPQPFSGAREAPAAEFLEVAAPHGVASS
jgi:eukaryotic-like serine/threonine-protein kinase